MLLSPGSRPATTGSINNRYSVNTLFSMAAELDVEIEDDLAKAQRRLRDLKNKISSQSKKNFVLERDLRYIETRIVLLIQNRMALEEQREVERTLEEAEPSTSPSHHIDDRKLQHYSNLFFLLQSEPRHIATLCRLVTLSEIETLLQTVMFTLYGNQYDTREEHLLLTMFQSVLAAQFESATDFGSLIRTNSPISRMMTTYTQRTPGRAYIKKALEDCIGSLIEHTDLDLEINPVKVYEQMIDQIEADSGSLPEHLPRGVVPEVAAANEDVQAIIAPRLTLLMEIANGVLAAIMDNIESVPYGIRWICKQIRSLARRRYPDRNEDTACQLIGGFFFLRFVTTTLTAPNTWQLCSEPPSEHPRRTLVLVAKMLQNLSNKPSYTKEAYMSMLNPFVVNNKTRMNQFLNQLCEVGDFYDQLEIDQYMALSKKDLAINITLNELFNTHALVLQHLDMLAPSEKQHLRIIAEELGPAPAQVSRQENTSVEIPLHSRWERPVQEIPAALVDTVSSSDMLYMEAKSILVHLIRSLPRAAGRPPYDLTAIAERAATARDAVLVRKGIKVREMLRELAAQGVTDPSDGYALMRDEVAAELAHLGSLRERVLAETSSLQAVSRALGEQQEYMRSQLEQYKAYLHNARLAAARKERSGAAVGVGVGVVSVAGAKSPVPKAVALGPYRFSHAQLLQEGIIAESRVPDNRRVNIYFNIFSPAPSTFIIALHYKGREQPIVELDLKLDDLLEQQQENKHMLDLEYVQFSVPKLLALFNKTFKLR
ncbi:hypothetical protein HGRIS_012372 [Hohenbuehelia grisea]|uniref:Ras-GAP domain-containing protein n=1 Tax=Hohenbuehelia grisea TaxID=104357 RepID=A0ABR3IS52_9AGAR